MAGKVEKRREELRHKLIDIAETIIARDGMTAIKARELAKIAGCAVGAIYNVFTDLDQIIIAVNGRTFRKLGDAVQASYRDTPNITPTEKLIVMSNAYLHFAINHPRLWQCLFDLQMPGGQNVPAWYLEELGKLYENISTPLALLFPEMNDQERSFMVRTLFSSVHGIVLLGLQNRISGVPRDQLEPMIALLLSKVTAQ